MVHYRETYFFTLDVNVTRCHVYNTTIAILFQMDAQNITDIVQQMLFVVMFPYSHDVGNVLN